MQKLFVHFFTILNIIFILYIPDIFLFVILYIFYFTFRKIYDILDKNQFNADFPLPQQHSDNVKVSITQSISMAITRQISEFERKIYIFI